MIEEIRPNLFRCEIPLPGNPLKMLNCYIVKAGKKSLIVDTGFNQKECRAAFFSYIEELDIDLTRSEVVITHLHSDHSGLASELYSLGAKLYFSAGDGRITKLEASNTNWEHAYRMMKHFGFENNEDFFERHPGKAFGTDDNFAYEVLGEGNLLKIGEYCFKVISVPGHTPDMINLYDEKKKIYLSGDHVLAIITPNIGYWGEDYPVVLNEYFNSLKKIYDYDIEIMLPSHRALINNHKKRIDELFDHHETRLFEIKMILNQTAERLTVQEIAAKMHWRIRAKNWSEFPDAQKWFAASEAMAHLDYLAYRGEISMRTENDTFYFSAKK